MAGRSSKTTDQIKDEKKSHRTKAEMEYREAAEQAVFTGFKFKERDKVKNNPVAHKEFIRLKKLYRKIQYIDALDEVIINRYCLTLAEIEPLEQLLEKMQEDVDACEKPSERIALYKTIAGTLMSVNRMKTLVTAWEDRMLLTPAGRMRAIPKTPPMKKQASPLQTVEDETGAHFDV